MIAISALGIQRQKIHRSTPPHIAESRTGVKHFTRMRVSAVLVVRGNRMQMSDADVEPNHQPG